MSTQRESSTLSRRRLRHQRWRFLVTAIALLFGFLIARPVNPQTAKADTESETGSRCFGNFVRANDGLIDVYDGGVDFGDYDLDNDLDLLLTGATGPSGDYAPVSQLYANDGKGWFVENASITLPGVWGGSVAWGDYDDDDNLDFILTGWNSSNEPLTRVYTNQGGGHFVESGISLPDVANSAVAWADYNGDDRLDLLITGVGTSGAPLSRLYRNDGGGNFTDSGMALVDVSQSAVAWGDYDNDRDLDLVLTGVDAQGHLTAKLYTNTGGVLTENALAQLSGVSRGSASWEDYDSDGDLDLLLVGDGDIYIPTTQLYTNNGSGGFTVDSNVSLTALAHGMAAWGDYDNDGDADLVLSGDTTEYGESRSIVTHLFTSDGEGDVILTPRIAMEWLGPSDVAWSDIDNDGDLDLLLAGLDENRVPSSMLYENRDCAPFRVQQTHPAANAVGVPATSEIIITYSLDVAQDSVTPSAVRAHSNFGTLHGELTVRGAQITFTPNRPFFAGEHIQISVNDQIRAVDNTSAADYQWGFTAGPINARCFGGFAERTDISFPGAQLAPASWADYDNDGDLDLLIGSQLYANDAMGGFEPANAPMLIGAPSPSWTPWGDYDNDGDLDLLLVADGAAKVFRNNGSGSFENDVLTLTWESDNPEDLVSDAIWGDYDNDGDLDVLTAGAESKLFTNEGNGNLVDSGVALSSVTYRGVAWVDHDRDGDIDIHFHSPIRRWNWSTIYSNDVDHDFLRSQDVYLFEDTSSAAWGDYDNDGDLDLAMSGWDQYSDYPQTVLWGNDGLGTLAKAGVNLARSDSNVSWADYDNDRDLDILAGVDYLTSSREILYENDGGGHLSDSGIILSQLKTLSTAWGDYDNDGDLDLLVVPETYGGAPVAVLYENQDCPEVRIIESFLVSSVEEGATDGNLAWACYWLTLNEHPGTDSVVVNIGPPTEGEIVVTKSSVTLNASNWGNLSNTLRTNYVCMYANDDAVDDSGEQVCFDGNSDKHGNGAVIPELECGDHADSIAHSIDIAQTTLDGEVPIRVRQADGHYADTSTVSVLVRDNDVAGLVFTPDSVSVAEGASTTYNVVLSSQPSATVLVTPSVTDDSSVTVAPASLTFTPAQWNVPQTVTITFMEDERTSPMIASIVHGTSSDDPKYNGLTPDMSSLPVSLLDNDRLTMLLSRDALEVSEGGPSESVEVSLTAQPDTDVVVTIIVADDASGQITVTPTELTFTSTNWNQPQAVVITAIDDPVDEGEADDAILTITAPDGMAPGSLEDAQVAVMILDDDSAGLAVEQPAETSLEVGRSTTYGVWLTSRPTSQVLVNIVSPGHINVTPTSLTYDVGNWDVPQVVTATLEGLAAGQIEHTTSSDDPLYQDLSASIMIQALDERVDNHVFLPLMQR